MAAIEQRLDAVYELVSKDYLAQELLSAMGRVDLERALGRVRNAAAAPQPGLPTWARQAAQRR